MARILALPGPDASLLSEQWDFGIVPGEQVWLLARSGTPELTKDTVQSAASEIVQMMVAAAKKESESALESIRTGPNDWTMGDARPVQIVVSRGEAPTQITGKVLASRVTFPGEGVPTLAASKAKPWYALVRLWWRGGEARVPWLIYGPGTLGMNIGEPQLNELVWMLEWAVVPADKSPDPGDKTWTQAQVERAGEVVKEAAQGAAKGAWHVLKPIATLGSLLGLGWLALKLRKGSKK